MGAYSDGMNEAQDKTILFCPEDFCFGISQEMLDNDFHGKAKLVTKEEKEQAIDNWSPDTLIAVIVSPSVNQKGAYCFKMLITVNGVGPKMGLAILSELTPDKIALSIAAGDHKALTKANGVGPKLAQRICMELKDKVGKTMGNVASSVDLSAVSSTLTNSNTAEAVAALEMLGYSQSDASVAVSKIDPSLSVEDIIKQALKMLSLG